MQSENIYRTCLSFVSHMLCRSPCLLLNYKFKPRKLPWWRSRKLVTECSLCYRNTTRTVFTHLWTASRNRRRLSGKLQSHSNPTPPLFVLFNATGEKNFRTRTEWRGRERRKKKLVFRLVATRNCVTGVMWSPASYKGFICFGRGLGGGREGEWVVRDWWWTSCSGSDTIRDN